MQESAGGNISNMLNKVPEVTFVFWIIKIMATTVGETAADFLAGDLKLGLGGTSVLMAGLLLISLFLQIRSKKYIPWLYWLTVVLVSIVGTLISDNLVDNLGVTLQAITMTFSLALLFVFIAWYASQQTLSIHAIHTTRREMFYWAAILITFALGTAAGDLAAEGLNLGYATSAMIFGGLIGLVYFTYYVFKANAIAAFWIAYILTRPFGASCGDLLSQPNANGGLALGTTGTSAVFLLIILGLVGHLTLRQKVAAAR
ncbi:hypothetical protein CAter282_2205 [Collimonas arenae]|uniref:Membrane-anchored protein n=1 Tax=Collimonas arenae TaxID=279058 RepID=A0A127PQL6_9BURK|nr:hypothetical protein [Collimonas arenae]AMP00063.1 hypothetical protein CAter10_2405 [Collimonas arenae]AMP09959.1 hypothetical protein CAter282_2205 [Collimonas arenae]